MNKNNEDHFEVLRKIEKNPDLSQRELAKDLGFSLGKLNYCLNALIFKGFVKINNFRSKKNKSQYIKYVLTPKGISERTKLTINYMKRKISSPRAIIVNANETSKNFYIKSKVNLASTGTMESSVGIIFLAQKRGKGGFIFELNKKKKFRIKELGTGAFITKEGVNGWLKSKIIAFPERDNTIEIKGFRGKFDIYINGNYLYSFLNNSYEKGNFGAYIGPNAEAKIFYYNVYKLDIPGEVKKSPLEPNGMLEV